MFAKNLLTDTSISKEQKVCAGCGYVCLFNCKDCEECSTCKDN